MNELVLIFAAVYGCLAVVFGAFGAHALKRKLSPEQIASFETGAKYQMYHALVLLIVGGQIPLQSTLEYAMAWLFVIGTFLFSFSIYGLCLSAAAGNKIRVLGPITPIGGFLLILGWVLLLVGFL